MARVNWAKPSDNNFKVQSERTNDSVWQLNDSSFIWKGLVDYNSVDKGANSKTFSQYMAMSEAKHRSLGLRLTEREISELMDDSGAKHGHIAEDGYYYSD